MCGACGGGRRSPTVVTDGCEPPCGWGSRHRSSARVVYFSNLGVASPAPKLEFLTEFILQKDLQSRIYLYHFLKIGVDVCVVRDDLKS